MSSELSYRIGVDDFKIAELRSFAAKVKDFFTWNFEDLVKDSPTRYKWYSNCIDTYLAYLKKNRAELDKVLGEDTVAWLEHGLNQREHKLRGFWELVGDAAIRF